MPSEDTRAKEKLEQLGRDWEVFKKENDQRLARLEKGEGTAEFDEKLDNLQQQMKAAEETKTALEQEKAAREALEERLEQIELKNKRPGKSGQGETQEAEEYRAAWSKFVRKGGNDADLLEKSGKIGVDTDGGYAVPEMLDTNIINFMRDQSPMRQLATVQTVSNEKYKQLVNKGGATAEWVGETDARNETDSPTLAIFEPKFGELAATPAATQTMLDDTVLDVERWYSDEVGEAFAAKEGSGFTLGDGVLKVMGFLAYPSAAIADSTRAYGTLQEMPTANAGVIDADDIIDLTYTLRAGYRQNARMMMRGATVASVRKLKDTNGQYLWQQSLILGQPSALAGYAVAENEDMPELASGSKAIAFGDFKRGYRILDVKGIRLLRDPFTSKPFVKFYTTKRIGGGCPNTQAIKLLKVA